MVARAVMKAWQEGLGGPPPAGRIHRSESDAPADMHWDRERPSSANDNDRNPLADDGDDDPRIQVSKREAFVPRRPGASSEPASDDSLWSSHLFWKGIVAGAGVVLAVKTAIAVHSSSWIDWYQF